MAEPVQFQAAPVNPTPFLIRQAQLRGAVASPQLGEMIAGDLYRPAGDGPFPAVIALHGCEGWPASAASRQRSAAIFVALGYVYLAVDSFGPRGISQQCVPVPAPTRADRPGDAFGALDWLGAQPFVDASRVALIGASQGADVVLYALSSAGEAQGFSRRFAAGVAFYPTCSPGFAIVHAPLLVLVGALDDWAPAAQCREMVTAPYEGGVDERLMVFPGAYHAFAGADLRDGPREVFGHHLAYDAAAAAAAEAAVATFLSEVLNK